MLAMLDVGNLLAMHHKLCHQLIHCQFQLTHCLLIDDFNNDSIPIDLLPADLDHAFMLPNNV